MYTSITKPFADVYLIFTVINVVADVVNHCISVRTDTNCWSNNG